MLDFQQNLIPELDYGRDFVNPPLMPKQMQSSMNDPSPMTSTPFKESVLAGGNGLLFKNTIFNNFDKTLLTKNGAVIQSNYTVSRHPMSTKGGNTPSITTRSGSAVGGPSRSRPMTSHTVIGKKKRQKSSINYT